MTTPALLEVIPQPCVLLRPVRDPQGDITDFAFEAANPAACDFHRMPSAQLIGSHLLDLHPNVRESGMFDTYRRIVETGEPLVLQDWGYAQDLLAGEWRYYDVHAVHAEGHVSLMWIDVTDRHRALRALEASEARARRQQVETRAIFDSQLDPFVRFTTVYNDSGWAVDLRFADVNPAAAAYNSLNVEQMVGRTFLDLYPNLMEHGPMAAYLRCAVEGTPVVLDDYAYDNEVLGSERRYDIRAVQLADGMALTWRDVTERYRTLERIRASEQRYRLLADNTSDVIWQAGADGTVTWASDSTGEILGWQPQQVLGEIAAGFLHPDDLGRALEARARVLQGAEVRQRFRVRRPDGTHQWMAFVVRPLPTVDGSARIIAMRDVSAEIAARDELERVIGRDSLTGLMTRESMESAITSAVVAAGEGRVALLCIGLDSLSTINDAFGHAAGDVVLTTTAARLVTETGDPDVVGRGAGVDFLVLVTETDRSHDATALAERIRVSAKAPVDLGRQVIEPTVSIGIATADVAEDAGQLIRSATLAMRVAKDEGRDRVAYASAELAAAAERRVTVVSAAAQALRAGEITPWFQPMHDLASGTRVGYEALARWVRPDGSCLEPAAFLPAVEASALIVELDEQILRQALDALRELPSPQFISANVSPRSLATPGYVDRVLNGLQASGVDPGRLHLEVTETALLDTDGPIVTGMRRIAETGARWYVDDFGTGYSSISHLRDLPIRGLKLDLSFTAGIARGEEQSVRLAQALAGLAQGLGLDTIAEGVETAEQEAILSSQGWRLGQGWLFGRAAPL